MYNVCEHLIGWTSPESLEERRGEGEAKCTAMSFFLYEVFRGEIVKHCRHGSSFCRTVPEEGRAVASCNLLLVRKLALTQFVDLFLL
uniref:Uncharacterized protein n=1 Tax=Setaria digitata TaxID=48799 RepID=A0A915PRP9_9BILA